MTIETIRQQFPDYAKDTKINLSKIFTEDGAPGLTIEQIQGIALASAYATQNASLISAVRKNVSLNEETVTGAKAAATIMGMNNIYYRFTHMVNDKDYSTMPANLRMTIIGNPGIAKIDFELFSLAVSALNGCGMCIEAHVNEVIKAGITKQGVQSTIRIASVINAAAQVIHIENL